MKEAIILLIIALLAREGKALAHEPYTEWTQPDNGATCCDDKDCKPTQSYRDENDEIYAKFEGKWIKVPKHKVLKFTAKDGNSHLCAERSMYGITVYCFAEGVPKS